MTIQSTWNHTKTSIRKALNRNTNPVITGKDDSANTSVNFTEGPPGLMWVRRMQASGTYGPPFAVQGSTSPGANQPGIPVEVGVDARNRNTIRNVNFAQAQALGINPTQYATVDPNTNNNGFVNQQFITTAYGQIVQGTLTVAIRGIIILASGTWYKLNAAIDLTSGVPSAGNHCLAVISVQNDYATLEVQYSTAKSTIVELDLDDVQEAWTATTSTNAPLWAFSLTGGLTALTEANRWADLRQLINIVSGGGTGDVVGPASATADDLAAFDGTTGKLIKDSGLSTANAGKAIAALSDKFILQVADATNLPNAQGLSTLATGYMKVTTTTGVVSSQATPIPVADGGTHLATLTAHNLIVGNGTGDPQFIAPGTARNMPISDGTDFLSRHIIAADLMATATDGQVLVRQDAQTDDMYWRDGLYPPNALVNGGFDFYSRQVITPTTATAYADGAYALDCWYVLTQTTTINVTQQTSTISNNGAKYNIALSQNQASAQRMGLAQIIESAGGITFRGRPSTFQFQVNYSLNQAIRYAVLEWSGVHDAPTKDVVNSWTSSTYTTGNFFITGAGNMSVLAVGSITPSASTWTKVNLSATPSTSCENLVVFIWTEGTAAQNALLQITEAAFVDGVDPVPWMPLAMSLESLRCQRFLKVFNSASGVATRLLFGLTVTTTTGRFYYTPPVPFFAVPAITATAADWNFGNSATAAFSAISVDSTSTVDAIIIAGTTGTTLANNAPFYLQGDTTADRYLILSAELGV